MDGKIKLAKKLKALADRGVGGEKDNAWQMLKDLMAKHGLTMEDIEGPKREQRLFTFETDQARIFGQVITHIMGRECQVFGHKRKKNALFTECTNAEFLALQATFEFYWRVYKEELHVFTTAFIHQNNLLPFDAESANMEEENPEEMEKLRRMMDGIDKQTIRKQLEQGS